MISSDDGETTRYTVHRDGLTEGPFDKSFIEAMVMSGVYPSSILVSRDGETNTFKWDQESGCPQTLPKRTERRQMRGGTAVPHSLFSPSERCDNTGMPPGGVDTVKSAQNSARPIGGETVFAWLVGIFAVFTLFWVFAQISDSRSSTKSSPGYASREPVRPQSLPTSTPPQRPRISETVYSPPPPPSHLATTIPPPRSYTQPTSVPPPTYSSPPAPRVDLDTQLYRDAYGRTYRVPNSAYGRLLLMKSTLEEQKRRLDQREEEVDTLRRRIDQARLYLDRTSQYAIDSFNRDVSRLNAMIEALQPAVDGFNRDVDSFNAELARVGTLIR